jgi:conjugal transfer/entry exclusion protein
MYDPPDLNQAIGQLRAALAAERLLGTTTEYLVQLQTAIEAADRAVRDERWKREGYEFQGE